MRVDRFYTDEASADHLEHLRRGTVKSYESPWVSVVDTGTYTFTHDLGDIPFTVDVSVSESAGGDGPVDGNSSATVTKTATTITLVSSYGSTVFFRVRAI